MVSDRPKHVISYSLIYYLLETSSCVIDGNHPTTIILLIIEHNGNVSRENIRLNIFSFEI